MKNRAVIATIIAAVILVASVWLAPRETMYNKSQEMMSTIITITVASKKPPKEAEAIIDAAFAAIAQVEKEMSFWSKDSEIAVINSYAGKNRVQVSARTLEMAKMAVKIAKDTEGGFDPTIGPLMSLWDYKKAVIPTESAINNARALVDYSKIIIDDENSTIMLADEGMSFDTGGIAKGYAADMAVAELKKYDIESGLVAIAGDIRAFGSRPDGRPWSVGIRDPRSDKPDEIIAEVMLMDYSISTSGDYERYFMKDDKRYHHIIDPKTGMPSIGLMSVSVLAPLAAHTDGYATGIFVKGPKEAMKTIKKLKLNGIVVDTEGKVQVTKGLDGWMKWKTEKYEDPT